VSSACFVFVPPFSDVAVSIRLICSLCHLPISQPIDRHGGRPPTTGVLTSLFFTSILFPLHSSGRGFTYVLFGDVESLTCESDATHQQFDSMLGESCPIAPGLELPMAATWLGHW
jgi:hypothetical protein